MKKTTSSMDFEIGSADVKRSSTRLAHNQWSGHSNDGRTVNYGRGHTVGNDGECGHSGFAHSGKKPPVSGTPSLPAQGSIRDNINRGSQVRGGGTAMPTCGRMEFNMGRGPTKGNQQ
jgi:hypothetical protein